MCANKSKNIRDLGGQSDQSGISTQTPSLGPPLGHKADQGDWGTSLVKPLVVLFGFLQSLKILGDQQANRHIVSTMTF